MGWDTDALAYLEQVENADRATLEQQVAVAINSFIIGCKRDGSWPAIRCSCILMGARTLAGALVPLAGPAPTNVNFVTGDYNRRTGLVADGATKRLSTNYAGNADPQNDCHGMAWVQTPVTSTGGPFFGASDIFSGNHRSMSWTSGGGNTNGGSFEVFYSCNQVGGGAQVFKNRFFGAWAVSRNSSSQYSIRLGGRADEVIALQSAAPSPSTLTIFATFIGGSAWRWGSARMAFYSFGRSLDIPSYSSRVSSLFASIGAAIQ